MQLNTDDLKMIDEISDRTSTDYGIKDNYIDAETLLCMLEDLYDAWKYDVEELQREQDDLREEVRENYRPIPHNEYDPRDFY